MTYAGRTSGRIDDVEQDMRTYVEYSNREHFRRNLRLKVIIQRLKLRDRYEIRGFT